MLTGPSAAWFDRGVLKIAEVSSRFTSFDDFVKLVKELGFSLANRVRTQGLSLVTQRRLTHFHPRCRTSPTRTLSCSTLSSRQDPTARSTRTR